MKELEIVQRALDATFPEESYAVQAIDDAIVVDAWTISRTEIDRHCLRGTVKIPGWSLDVTVPIDGHGISPDDVSLCEVASDVSINRVILALVAEIAKCRASAALERICA